MKVTLSKGLRINIEDMEGDEIQALITKIRGAGLEERRIFHKVLVDLNVTPIDKLERRSPS